MRRPRKDSVGANMRVRHGANALVAFLNQLEPSTRFALPFPSLTVLLNQ